MALHLASVRGPDVLLISDTANAYDAFARSTGIPHEAINVRRPRKRGTIHLDNVNGWHGRFNGVASRYLANNTGWQRVLDAVTLPHRADWLIVSVTRNNNSRSGWLKALPSPTSNS